MSFHPSVFKSGLFPSDFRTKIFLVSYLSNSCYIPCPSHPPPTRSPFNVWCRVRTVQLLVAQFYPALCHVFHFWSEYFLQRRDQVSHPFGPVCPSLNSRESSLPGTDLWDDTRVCLSNDSKFRAVWFVMLVLTTSVRWRVVKRGYFQAFCVKVCFLAVLLRFYSHILSTLTV